MFEFTVPDGDWDFDPETRSYCYKDLVFTESKKKDAIATIKEYVKESVDFTMMFVPKEK